MRSVYVRKLRSVNGGGPIGIAFWHATNVAAVFGGLKTTGGAGSPYF